MFAQQDRVSKVINTFPPGNIRETAMENSIYLALPLADAGKKPGGSLPP
jgi:hypothetical protein